MVSGENFPSNPGKSHEKKGRKRRRGWRWMPRRTFLLLVSKEVPPGAVFQAVESFKRLKQRLIPLGGSSWVNYNELTTSSLEIIVSKGNHPQMALIQVSELL